MGMSYLFHICLNVTVYSSTLSHNLERRWCSLGKKKIWHKHFHLSKTICLELPFRKCKGRKKYMVNKICFLHWTLKQMFMMRISLDLRPDVDHFIRSIIHSLLTCILYKCSLVKYKIVLEFLLLETRAVQSYSHSICRNILTSSDSLAYLSVFSLKEGSTVNMTFRCFLPLAAINVVSFRKIYFLKVW